MGATQLPGVPWTWPQKLWDLRQEYGFRDNPFEDDVSFEDLPFHREALAAIKRNPTLDDYVAVSGVFCKFGVRQARAHGTDAQGGSLWASRPPPLFATEPFWITLQDNFLRSIRTIRAIRTR